MHRSHKLLWTLLTAALLASCNAAADRAHGFGGVPLLPFDPAAEKAAAFKIVAVCGNPPRCPADAVLEQATLDYIKQRDLIRAASK